MRATTLGDHSLNRVATEWVGGLPTELGRPPRVCRSYEAEDGLPTLRLKISHSRLHTAEARAKAARADSSRWAQAPGRRGRAGSERDGRLPVAVLERVCGHALTVDYEHAGEVVTQVGGYGDASVGLGGGLGRHVLDGCCQSRRIRAPKCRSCTRRGAPGSALRGRRPSRGRNDLRPARRSTRQRHG